MKLQLPSKVSQCDAWEFMSSQISDNAVNTRGIMKLLMIRKSVNYATHIFFVITFSCVLAFVVFIVLFLLVNFAAFFTQESKNKKLVNFLFCGRKHRLTPDSVVCRKEMKLKHFEKLFVIFETNGKIDCRLEILLPT